MVTLLKVRNISSRTPGHPQTFDVLSLLKYNIKTFSALVFDIKVSYFKLIKIHLDFYQLDWTIIENVVEYFQDS